MKYILPLIAVLLILTGCDNTKIQLRAPKPKTEKTTAKANVTNNAGTDSVKADSTSAMVKK